MYKNSFYLTLIGLAIGIQQPLLAKKEKIQEDEKSEDEKREAQEKKEERKMKVRNFLLKNILILKGIAFGCCTAYLLYKNKNSKELKQAAIALAASGASSIGKDLITDQPTPLPKGETKIAPRPRSQAQSLKTLQARDTSSKASIDAPLGDALNIGTHNPSEESQVGITNPNEPSYEETISTFFTTAEIHPKSPTKWEKCKNGFFFCKEKIKEWLPPSPWKWYKNKKKN